MDTSRLRILLAGILAFGCGIDLLRTPVSAQDAVPNDLVGIWAHSKRDCGIKLSGKLDRGNMSRMDQTPYQFIGFCKAGVDWLYQPVGCAASTVAKEGNGYRYSGKCREKDYPLADTSFSIKRTGPDSISFADFSNQDFMIEGTYVRCSQAYDCTEIPDAEQLAEPPATTEAEASPPQATQQNELAPLSTFKDCDHCPEMIVLPTGSYLMGAGADDFRVAGRSAVGDELPQHRVTIAYPVALAKFELTVEEFAAYVDETGVKTGGECMLRIPETGPSAGRFIGTPKRGAERYPGLVTVIDADFRTPGATVTARQPAACISRREAEGYLDWLSKKTGKHYRLPSESEWEYAARAGTNTAFYFGSDRRKLCSFGNFADRASPYNASFVAQCREKPSPVSTAVVGSYQPNPWGFYDMAGNVFEFTADCSSSNYNNAPTDGSPYVVPGCKYFVQRSYTLESMDTLLRSASRCAIGEEDDRSNILGLRVAVDLADVNGPEDK